MATHDENHAHPRDDAQAPPRPAHHDTMDAPAKPSVRSWRKKYRKMRVRFDERMRESNTLFREEHKAIALARRLQEQNDQLMDLLLDINDTPKIPQHLRFLLDIPYGPDAVVEPHDPDTLHRKLQEAREDFTAGRITQDEFAAREAALTAQFPGLDRKALAELLKTPHTHLLPPEQLPDDLVGESLAGFLSPNHEEEYLKELDVALGDSSLYDPNDTSGRPIRLPARDIPSDKELQIRNPDSVYNWLRKHQPQVFLQDKENDKGDAAEKGPKGGNGRGGGKRGQAAAATPMKADPDDDDAFVPETGSGRGKRSKVDDEPYRPKGGSSRPSKRKREDGEGGGGRGGRKKAARGGAAAAAS
ncbi:hypothetical protein GTA08_BOTSDO03169 [Botryosphaeria dothidea]|uniref:IEC3 subunit of the Ino80 complex, chromatin re-modelling-domain-containing protein n=1 Tax=Botryosphaeria dothidea TaxID=55169 RepID=A0A8H4IYN4_9PEZI|nr:hypothetical protein GTA08_BOTSDO03169 [Botryosphaeria dothidea]